MAILKKEKNIEQRHQIAALLNQKVGIRETARRLGVSTSTVNKVKAILEDPSRTLDEDRREQNARPEYFDEATMKIVLQLRANTALGARMLFAMINADPEAYGIDPKYAPSVGTIAKWLSEAGATGKTIGAKDDRGFPVEWDDTSAGIIAIDGTGPVHWGADRIYITTAQDYSTRLSIAVPTTSRIESASVNTWTHIIHMAKKHLLPDSPMTHVFADNGEMGIANGWTKNSVRHVLAMGAIMVFNAPGKPWKSGRLENWHHTMKRTYVNIKYSEAREKQNKRERRGSTQDWIREFVQWVNWYNMKKPHQAITGKTKTPKSPASAAAYLPVTEAILSIPKYEELPPQKGIIDIIRLVWNDGTIDLWGYDQTRIQKLFGGQFVRIRFECDPAQKEQVGKVVWQRGRHKEPLVIATFNHKMDRNRKRDDAFIYNMQFIDFENEGITPPPQNYYRNSGLTSGKLNDKTPKFSSEHWTQASRIKEEMTARNLLADMVSRFRYMDIEEDVLEELIEEAKEQIFYERSLRR